MVDVLRIVTFLPVCKMEASLNRDFGIMRLTALSMAVAWLHMDQMLWLKLHSGLSSCLI